MTNLSPIAIFACRRPRHFENLVESLKQNQEAVDSNLYVFVGGPKVSTDLPLVKETLRIAQQISGFRSVNIIEYPNLKRGSDLIQTGVNYVLGSSECIIVLEDDLKVRADFLSYMNSALLHYAKTDMVVQISGWNYGIMSRHAPHQTYFFPNLTPWGWGTWKRAWPKSDNVKSNFEWLVQRSSRITRFNFQNNYDCLGMIESVVANDYDAWDAKWYLETFRHNGLVLHPNSSLTLNQGFDGSGLNFKTKFSWKENFDELPQHEFNFPANVEISSRYSRYLDLQLDWIKKSNDLGFFTSYLGKVKRRLRQHQRYYKPGFYSQ